MEKEENHNPFKDKTSKPEDSSSSRKNEHRVIRNKFSSRFVTSPSLTSSGLAKEVKTSKAGSPLLDIINSLKEGKNLKQIRQELNISKQLLSYYLSSLKKQNLIKKVGYGTWELTELATSKKMGKVATSVRGHSFLFKVKINKPINWIKLLTTINYPYKLVNKVPSILFQERKIWLASKHIIIYEPDSFMANNSVNAKKYAIIHLIELLEALERKLDINLKPYQFKVSRQHYSLIKNCLAVQCNRIGQKIQVSNQNGLWFLIDNSYNLNEAENVHPETALEDSLGIQKYFNEHKETKFEVTPKFILSSFQQMMAIQVETNRQLLEYKEQNKQHLKLIKEYRKENKLWRKHFTQELKKPKPQKTLWDY